LSKIPAHRAGETRNLIPMQKVSKAVTPANAGVQSCCGMISLDSRVRGNDNNGCLPLMTFLRDDPGWKRTDRPAEISDLKEALITDNVR